MAPKKQIYKCPKCDKDTFRDNNALKKHKDICKGALGKAQISGMQYNVVDQVAVNYTPMERNHLQNQSISGLLTVLQGRGFSTIQSVLQVNVADFHEMFVAMFRFCWFNNDHPEHHHVLHDLEDSTGLSCVVYKKQTWQFVENVVEIRECLNTVAVRFYEFEIEIRDSMTRVNFERFERYRQEVENLSAMPTSYEKKMKEGILTSEINVDKTLLYLVNRIRDEMKAFTTVRKELLAEARKEAEENRDRVHSDWLVDGALYNDAIRNYHKYKDWLPGKPLDKEYLKVIATFKECLTVSRDNIKKGIDMFLDIDEDLYRAWQAKHAKTIK